MTGGRTEGEDRVGRTGRTRRRGWARACGRAADSRGSQFARSHS